MEAVQLTFQVIVLPGPIVCAKCYHAMRFEPLERGATNVIGYCTGYQCEAYGIALEYPIPPPVELKRAP